MPNPNRSMKTTTKTISRLDFRGLFTAGADSVEGTAVVNQESFVKRRIPVWENIAHVRSRLDLDTLALRLEAENSPESSVQSPELSTLKSEQNKRNRLATDSSARHTSLDF